MGKFFLADRVRIAWNAWLKLSTEKSKRAGEVDFIGLIALSFHKRTSGAVFAFDCVGQRDTRWFIPLTVSGGCQGEEGAYQISGACSYPTAASAFYILGYGAVGNAACRNIFAFLAWRFSSLVE